MEIRSPRPDDHAQWASLFIAYAHTGGVDPTPEAVARLWDWIQNAGCSTECLVAAEGDALWGFVHFREVERPILADHTGYIDDVYTSPDARGRGVGRLLMQTVLEQGRERGWALVRWTTKQTNLPANRLYASMAELATVNLYVARLA